MLFELTYPLDTPEKRKHFAERLSALFPSVGEFQPYKPNENDDYFWTLDQHNDWKVKFFRTPIECRFNLTYRYQSEGTKAEEAISGWIVRQHAAKILSHSKVTLHHIEDRCKRLMKFQHPTIHFEQPDEKRFVVSYCPVPAPREQHIIVASLITGSSAITYDSQEVLKLEELLLLFHPRAVGYRIVPISEYGLISAFPKNDETVEMWDNGTWILCPTLHLDYSQIYQTKRLPPNL